MTNDGVNRVDDNWRLHPIGEMLARNFIHFDPIFLKNGGIRTAQGYYKIVENMKEHYVALVYGKEPDDLTGHEWYPGSDLTPAFPTKTIPVAAYKYGPPLNDWLTDIELDQRERIKLEMAYSNLYHRVPRPGDGGDAEIYGNNFVTYAIFPLWKKNHGSEKLVRKAKANKAGSSPERPAKFEVWFYIDVDGKENHVDADPENPSWHMAWWTTRGKWLKRFDTIEECRKFICEDFVKRCNHPLVPNDIASIQDADPLHAYLQWFRNYLESQRLMENSDSFMEMLGIGVQFALKGFRIYEVIPDILMSVVQKVLGLLPLRKPPEKTLMERLTGEAQTRYSLPQATLDPAEAENLHFLDDSQSGVRRGRVKVYNSLKDAWQVAELLSGVHRREHCLVSHLGNGIISVHERNGIKVYYDTERKECYALYSGNFKFHPRGTKQEDMPQISERFKPFFKNGMIIKLHRVQGHEPGPSAHQTQLGEVRYAADQTLMREPIRAEFMLEMDAYCELAGRCGRAAQDLRNEDLPGQPLFAIHPTLPYIPAPRAPVEGHWGTGPDGKLMWQWKSTEALARHAPKHAASAPPEKTNPVKVHRPHQLPQSLSAAAAHAREHEMSLI